MTKVESIYKGLLDIDKSKSGFYPVHKKLKLEKRFPQKDYKDISDWIIDQTLLTKNSKVLDAGCGVGYVLIKLCKQYNCVGLGVSLSPDEIKIASKNAEIHNANCQFKVKDFSTNFDQKYDLIIAIESIKHSSNLQKSISNLSNSLAPNGQLIILEDYYNGENVEGKNEKAFKESWHVPQLFDKSTFQKICSNADLHLDSEIDFTSLLSKKSKLKSQALLTYLTSKIYNFLPQIDTIKKDIYIGALIMDYFYSTRKFEYLLQIYKKDK